MGEQYWLKQGGKGYQSRLNAILAQRNGGTVQRAPGSLIIAEIYCPKVLFPVSGVTKERHSRLNASA
jgi:hypothetical protein